MSISVDTGVPKREEKEKETRKIFERMTENYYNFAEKRLSTYP